MISLSLTRIFFVKGDKTMQIIGEIKGYVIHKSAENNYSVCRILNEYESREEAQDDLYALLAKNITEKDLLKKYSKKSLFD